MDRNALYRLEAIGITVDVDVELGNLAKFEVERDGRRSAPFHRAPWSDDEQPPEGVEGAPHLARISGDFFCAPFAAADVEPAPRMAGRRMRRGAWSRPVPSKAAAPPRPSCSTGP